MAMEEKAIYEALGIPTCIMGKFGDGATKGSFERGLSSIVCGLEGVSGGSLQMERTEAVIKGFSTLSVMVDVGNGSELMARFIVTTGYNPNTELSDLLLFYSEIYRSLDATSPAAQAIAEINKQFTQMAAKFVKENSEVIGV